MEYVSVLQLNFAVYVSYNKVDVSSVLLEFDDPSCLFYCYCFVFETGSQRLLGFFF